MEQQKLLPLITKFSSVYLYIITLIIYLQKMQRFQFNAEWVAFSLTFYYLCARLRLRPLKDNTNKKRIYYD